MIMCSKCNSRPPNPNRKWCQMCFLTQGNNVQGGGGGPVCSNCQVRSPNPGYSWCQPCFDVGGGNTNFGGGPMCSNCHVRSPNPGYSLCQLCFGGGKNLCKNCHTQPPNPGFSWCQKCFGGGKNLCTNCHTLPPNPGFSWCQKCFGGGKNLCKNCHTLPPNPGYSLCQKCFGGGNVSSGQLQLKNPDQGKRNDIQKQFNDGMRKKGKSFTIINIFSIWDKSRNKVYESYKQKISNKNGGDPNQQRWWHGSKLKCDLMNSMKLCNGHDCCICGILSKGFLMKSAGKNFGWLRFGPGLYFAPDAGKSDDYTTPHNGIKCMILCKVVVGNAKIYFDDQKHLKGVPSGFDSILGEKGPVLNFPELVLYNEDAVIPSYVVFYKC